MLLPVAVSGVGLDKFLGCGCDVSGVGSVIGVEAARVAPLDA